FVRVQRMLALQYGQRYAEADTVLAEFMARDAALEGVWAFQADNQLKWGMAEARAGRGQEPCTRYRQRLEWLARAGAIGEGDTESLELQAKLQQALQALAEGSC